MHHSADQQLGVDVDAHPSDRAPSQPDPYLDRLSPDDREAYRAASPDVDLSLEIRLIRTILSHLAANLPVNQKSMTPVLGVLVRAVSLQSKQSGAQSDLERELVEAAEKVLKAQQSDR